MRMLHALLLSGLLAVASVLMACAPNQSQTESVADSVAPPREYTLDEDIGMMLLLGFRGQSIDSTHHVWADIVERHVGSVILFDYDAPSHTRGRNIASAEQLQHLTQQLRQLNPQLLIGVDQEGGYVSRLAPRYGFPSIPTAKRLAAMGDDSVRHYAALTAQMLTQVGINLNFAPVADVDVNPACPIIGAIGRSFSADADKVAHCCTLWIDEQRRGGVVSCMKHFPGHGSAQGDTHQGMVDVSHSWSPTELIPYHHLAAEGTMVMTAHVINRQLDPTGLPASLSPRMGALLRDSLGFEGVIVTDDLAMGAISGHYTLQQTLRLAIEAGADLLCLSNNGGTYNPLLASQAVAIIKQMVEQGVVSRDRVRQSANRVRALIQQVTIPNTVNP